MKPKKVRKRLRNPKFKQESLTGLSWTRVVSRKFPHLRETICCDGKARVDEMVITIPLIKGGECIGTTVLHAECMRNMIKEIPPDVTIIRKRAQAIRNRFHDEMVV